MYILFKADLKVVPEKGCLALNVKISKSVVPGHTATLYAVCDVLVFDTETGLGAWF